MIRRALVTLAFICVSIGTAAYLPYVFGGAA